MLDYQRIEGDERVAVQFEAAQALLREAKVALREGSLVGATEKVVAAEFVLTRALIELEVVTNVPWAAIAHQPDFAKRPAVTA